MCPVSVCVGAKCIWIRIGERENWAAIASANEWRRHLKVLPEYYQQISRSTLAWLYIHYEINALSSYTTFRVVNQLAFLLVLPFFLACNSFRFTAQEIPDPPKAEQIMQIHWKRKAFLEVVFFSFFFHLSRIYVCRFALLLFIHWPRTWSFFWSFFYFLYELFAMLRKPQLMIKGKRKRGS